MEINYPFSLAILVLLIVQCLMMPSLAKAATKNITTDQYVFHSLKSHLNLNPSHILSKNWSDSTYVCCWIGVTCGFRHQRVIALDVSAMNLTGNLLPQLANLSFLVSLNMSNNNFQGSVPQDFSRLRRLRVMDLAFNELSGSIPPWFGLLPRLVDFYLGNNHFDKILPLSHLTNGSKIEVLDLSYNPLHGNYIPQEIGYLNNLKLLGLEGNQLSGFIPSTLSNLSNLERLYLRNNSLSGNLGDNIFHGLPKLELLDVGNNNFTGSIPEELGNNTNLRILDMQKNLFAGSIPPRIFNISSLQYINIDSNRLSGILPTEMCSNLKQLYEISLYDNGLHGFIPSRLYECSALETLELSSNNLHGSIPKEIGNSTSLKNLYLTINNLTGPIPGEVGNLENLEVFEVLGNKISGSIPTSLLNISTLRILSLSQNRLTGYIASDVGYKLPNLVCLEFARNSLMSESQELTFITSLTNCTNLNSLGMDDNPLNGIIPASVGNLSIYLNILYACNCGLRGRIPDEIGNLTNLLELNLFGNQLTGSMPKTLGNLRSLQGLILSGNRLSRSIPTTLCELQDLNVLKLMGNQLYGAIPDSIGNVTTLSYLRLDSNQLNSSLPRSLWDLQNLLELTLSSNFLIGPLLPEMGNLKTASLIDLSRNQFSGVIPSTVEFLQQVSTFSLAYNSLEGNIPESVNGMVNLEILDLSHNNLSGLIPTSLEKLQHLKYFNVSFNVLSGEIPSDGPFKNFTSQSFLLNEGLCGDSRFDVPPCQLRVSHNRKLMPGIVFILSGIISFVFILLMLLGYLTQRNRRKERVPSISHESLSGRIPFRVSYYEIIEATNRFEESNLLGSGSFGTVYKGTHKNGTQVAIKIFNLKSEWAFKSFEVECEVLRNLRHNNLCKVLGSCSNQEFKALVLEYMPNGSLEKWLYSHNFFLDLVQRISLMVDVACALEYLHHDCPTPVIHCDLKPSNVLLDEHMVAHLCDFGISKLLGDGESVVHTLTIATLGYIAPEFGSNGLVSTRSDVYSYGILLMEVFTRKKPSDETFDVNSSLRGWIKDSIPKGIIHIVDSNLLSPNDECIEEKLKCLSSIMELALNCSMESPHERISIKDACVALKKIKSQFLLAVACGK